MITSIIRALILSLFLPFGYSLIVNGQGLPRNYWQDMTTEDFAALDAEQVIAILPVAAIEQHGPHLPVCADACANKAVIERMLELVPSELPVTVLPMMPVGKSNEHSDFPGTLTLQPETLCRLWTEIAESVHRVGIRKLVLFNSHGGQPQIMDIVARDLRVRLDMMVVVVNQYSLYPQDLFPEDEMKHGIHGGSVETSVMLHIRPDLVDTRKAQNFRPLMKDLEGDFQQLSFTGPTRIAWQSQDLNPAGVVGNALNADAERGAQLIDHAATQFVSILQEVERYPLGNLRIGPLKKNNE
ncbi:creatininase family protein [Yeosuana sp. MJ-SS3]|uniref:Creatininase family protein n=1 Tax=Gilvirhabdus luticola TaxID=3079858 RepID=A0ABU3U8V5_9FLAO|nr:creatininase family protein [Yeosuana sp. MJ-SS3]MDU8886820.1 creatininase family protein [Yeosuana sp. MJ-SS3]